MSGPQSMVEAFAATVARRAESPALHYFGTSLSFADLDADSDAFAAALQQQGFHAGERVALYLQNVPQFLIALLGTWKAGGIAVAVSPMLRHKELRHLLLDSGASVLVALRSLWAEVGREAVAGTAVARCITTADDSLLGGAPPPAMIPSLEADEVAEDLGSLLERHAGSRPRHCPLGRSDVAILTYTSGTTGPPKGAMNSHGNVLAAAEAYRAVAQLDGADSVLGVAPLFHVTGLTAHIGVSLLVGIPIVLTYRFDIAAILEAVQRHRPTFTVAAITAYVALMNSGGAFSSLQKTLSGGAPIAPALAEAWRQHSGVPLYPVYGLTETTGPTHMVALGQVAPVDAASGALSVGRTVPGTEAWVVGEDGAVLPPGVAGELLVRGPQVVAGYWRQPEETASAFVDGAMRTGDVAVIDREGWCYIVDRKKDLINASGYKVWPREVEDGLLAHPAVREAAVVGVPDPYRGESVRAFVSLRAGAQASSDELIQYCRERMAAYKYPRELVILDELPKSASGKILRRVLRGAAAHPAST